MGDISSRRSPSPPRPIPHQRAPTLDYHAVFRVPADAIARASSLHGNHRKIAKNRRFILEEHDPRTVIYVVKYGTGQQPRTWASCDSSGLISASPKSRPEKIKVGKLQNKWPSLSNDEKLGVAQQLKVCLDSLWTIPHEGLFAYLNMTALQDAMSMSMKPDPVISGLFGDEQSFIAGIINKHERDGTEITYVGPDRIRFRAAYFCQVLPRVCVSAGEPTLTRGDVQRKNIMVQPDGTIALLDWVTSGWCSPSLPAPIGMMTGQNASRSPWTSTQITTRGWQ